MGQLAEHVLNHPFLVGGLLVMFAAVVFVETRIRSQARFHVSAADAVRLMNGGAIVIDVRSPEEFQQGHIVNARNVELARLTSDPGSLKKQKNKVLITVCDNGINSNRAAGVLRKAGFEKVFSLKGGLNGWRAENLPLVK
ncbi:MAG TPA: rhodanese-like domain-containing protein [Gammaproteobacteria bacterium]